MPPIVFLLPGYLLGSIPFGLLLTRAAGLGDIRRIGSGNIGATNVLRTGNKALAAATLLLDAGRAPPPSCSPLWLGGHAAVLWAGVGAVLGHAFPVWLRLQGRQGRRHGLRRADRRRLASWASAPAPSGWSWPRWHGLSHRLAALAVVRARADPCRHPGRHDHR